MLPKLKELIGKKFSYKGNELLIKNTKKVSGVYVVLTDKKTLNFFESEVSFFLKEIIEIPIVKLKTEVLIKRQMELQEKKDLPIENENLNIRKVLVETIEKLRKDKSYIPQANAICNVVSQMINIQKLELQLHNQKR
jgi:hypothetical protein